MASISTTTLPELGALFVTQILATTPRITRDSAREWKHYTRRTGAASRSRRFTLVWEPRGRFRGGYFTNSAVECVAGLAVRTDYVGKGEHIMEMINDDWLQLRDRLGALHIPITNGLTYVAEEGRPTEYVDPGSRSTISPDAFQYDLTYEIRYQQAGG